MNKPPIVDHIKEDLRRVDMKFMNNSNIQGWNNLWEGVDGLHAHANIIPDSNQSAWHLSRISYLCGYLHAKGIKEDMIHEMLKNHTERCKK